MITGFIKGQALQISSPVIVASSIDYLEAKFAFQTGDWEDLEKWAHFTCGSVSHVIRLKDDKIGREMHLNLFAGTWKVYIHGTGKSGMRITTNEAELTVRPTGAENDEVFPTIPPSVAEQVALDAREARETAEQLMEDTQAKLEELNEAGDVARAAAKEANDAAAESRVVSENIAKNEETRQANEQAREKNEQTRQNRETERSREFNTLKDDVNRATDNAYRVIDDAAYALQVTYEQLNTTREETERAKTAADAATEAAEGARAATNTANEAADRVDASVTEAEEATSRANAATERADTAAQGAETATEQASAAATNAQDATINADRATDNANEAASRANEAAQGINNKFANALKGKASGEAVVINDVSPIDHTIDTKVKSKNLAMVNEQELNGNYLNTVIYKGYINTSFCLSWEQDFVSSNGAAIFSVYAIKSGEWVQSFGDRMQAQSRYKEKINPTNEEVEVRIVNWSGFTGNLTNIQLEVGTEPTEYSPFIDVSTVKVKAQGKNLIPFPYTESTITRNGITYTVNDNGSITLNGTTTGNSYIILQKGFDYGQNIDGWGGGGGTNGTYCGSDLVYYNKANKIVSVNAIANKEYNNYTIYPQIELGTVSTEYEPFVEPTEYTVNADGTIDNLYSIYPTTTLIVDTPNVTIDAEYNKDANKVVASLENRIAALEAMIINN